MQRSLIVLLFVFLACVSALAQTPATPAAKPEPAEEAPVDCRASLDEHIKTDLGLSYQEFDQTLGQGFRPLSAAGCFREVAELIALYIDKNQATEGSLVWHLAQSLASAGETAQAIEIARRCLRPDEDFAVNPLRWNDYVLATIGFLERDRKSLLAHRDLVAEGVEDFAGNQLNLKLLDALIRHFDKPYAYATSHIED